MLLSPWQGEVWEAGSLGSGPQSVIAWLAALAPLSVLFCLIGIFINSGSLRRGLRASLAQLSLFGRLPTPASLRDGHPSQLF